MANKRAMTSSFHAREQEDPYLPPNKKALLTATRDGKSVRIVRSFRVARTVELPILPGVNGLSKQEIRKDLRDIGKTVPTELSESDCSVISDEVMPSPYPVKPRSTPKRPLNGTADNGADMAAPFDHHHQTPREEDDDHDDSQLEETMEFLKMVEMTRDDVFQAEKQREQLELQYMSLRDTYVSKAKDQSYRGRGQENLLRALQGLCVRNVRNVSLLHRRNAMMCDVIKALRWKSQACKMMKENCRLQTAEEDSTSVLKINVSSPNSQTHPQTLTIYLGLALRTPYGEAVVEEIRPKSETAGLLLEWGARMHCPLARLVSWGPFDLASDRQMCRKWDALGKRIRLDESYSQTIASLIRTSPAESGEFSNDKDGDDDRLDEGQINGDDEVPMSVETTEPTAPNDSTNPSSNISANTSPSKDAHHSHQIPEWANEMLRGCHSSLPLPSDGIPFLLAPVRALPVMLDQLKTKPRVDTQVCRRALHSSLSPLSQSLEAARMQQELKSLQESIRALENEQTVTLAQVHDNRNMTDSVTQMTSAMRAQMQTRKQRQRSVLQAHGVYERPSSITSTTPAFQAIETTSAPPTAMDMLTAVLANESMKSADEDTGSGSVGSTLNMDPEPALGSWPPTATLFSESGDCEESTTDIRTRAEGYDANKRPQREQRKAKHPRSEGQLDGPDSDPEGLNPNPNATPNPAQRANGSSKRNKRRRNFS